MKRWLLMATVILALCLAGWAISGVAAQTRHHRPTVRQARAHKTSSLAHCEAVILDGKKTLMKEGRYNCCLKHPCSLCALTAGMCPCGGNAATDKQVCNECKGGWDAGDGAIAGKTASQIKTFPRK